MNPSAPIAKTFPLGSNSVGPTSPGGSYTGHPGACNGLDVVGVCKSFTVLPEVVQIGPLAPLIRNRSDSGAFETSSVKKLVSGSSVQPSSELNVSVFPLAVTTAQLNVVGSSTANACVNFDPTRNRPSANISAGASPTHCMFGGGVSAVH